MKRKKWKQRELEFRLYVPAGNPFSMKEDKYFTSIENWQDRQEESETSLVLLNGFTVQYTGVKDVNGVKIFEGDIVDVLPYPKQEWIGYVKYCSSAGCFIIDSLISDYGSKTTEPIYTDCKIIGNVFQNPELVEKYKLEV